MKNFIIGMVVTVTMSGLCFGGDCANGRCNLNRRHVQSVISSTEVLSPPEVTGVPEMVSSPTSVRSQPHGRTNLRRGYRRAVRAVR